MAKPRSCCTVWQWIFGIGFTVFLSISFLVFVLGYAVPKAHFDGYNLSLCTCLSTNISTNAPYVGDVNLQFGQIIKNIIVITSRSKSVVQNYLNANYRVNNKVICYVNSDDIVVTPFSSAIAVIFGVVTLIIGLCFLAAFCAYTFRIRKRMNYVDLDAVSTYTDDKATDGGTSRSGKPDLL